MKCPNQNFPTLLNLIPPMNWNPLMLRPYLKNLPALLALLLPIAVGCSPSNDQNAAPETAPPPAAQVDEQHASQPEGLVLLEDEAERAAAIAQGICPVSGEPLGSMGKPIKLTVEGREVYICCSGCEDALREDPEKYFSKLDQRQTQ